MQENNTTSITFIGTVIWLLACAFFLYEFFLRTLIGTVGSQVISDMHLSAGMFAMLGSAYYLAYGSMQVPVGIIADKFGIRNTLLFGAMVCVMSAYGFAASTNFTEAFISRVMMGFGSSFAFVCLLSVVAAWFPRHNFGIFSGASQFIGTMGPFLAAGPLASVLTKMNGDWRLLLNRIGLAGVILVTLIFLVVRNKSSQKSKSVVFIKRPESIKNRLKRLMQNPQILYVSFYSALMYGPMALLGAVWGTIYLQSHGYSQTTSANTISIAWLGYAVGCLSLGAVSDFIKRRKTVLIACSALGVFAASGIVFINTHSIYVYTFFFACLGLAASGQALSCAAISEHSDSSTRATAFGLNNGSVIIFNVFFPPLVGVAISYASGAHGGNFQPHDFLYGFAVMPVLYALALINSLFFIEETYCKSKAEMIFLQVDPASAY